MALMFPRLARNFIKNGYFPTDEDTLARVLQALRPSSHGEVRIIDPTAGEGVALAECKAWLQSEGGQVAAYGVEYDAERAWHAKRLLDRCIHGSLFDCVIGLRSFGLLFLNPPYGDVVSDKGQTGDGQGKQRLEAQFLRQASQYLQFGGVMVLIVPLYILAGELGELVGRYFERVEVFMAPEQQFKQVVIFGVRTRAADNTVRAAETRNRLRAIAEGALPPELPDCPWDEPYVVPGSTGEVKFIYTQPDAAQLAEEVKRFPCLWQQFDLMFGSVVTTHRRPLRQLSDWHLALVLAAGQISGMVRAQDGRIYVVKGDTHKEKAVKVTTEINQETGSVSEVRTALDRFVPVIRALDFTPGSETYGQALTIR